MAFPAFCNYSIQRDGYYVRTQSSGYRHGLVSRWVRLPFLGALIAGSPYPAHPDI
jgi:hypothetical protein